MNFEIDEIYVVGIMGYDASNVFSTFPYHHPTYEKNYVVYKGDDDIPYMFVAIKYKDIDRVRDFVKKRGCLLLDK